MSFNKSVCRMRRLYKRGGYLHYLLKFITFGIVLSIVTIFLIQSKLMGSISAIMVLE